ncbi:MAG: hypothetical protein IE927_06710 [Rhodobacterales bacterium]|nr:hypothetical protein [Rhodobacterales bacterium]
MTAAIALSPNRDCAAPTVPARLRARTREDRLNNDPSWTQTRDDTWETLLARANAGDGAAFARFLTLVTPTLRAVIRCRGAMPTSCWV